MNLLQLEKRQITVVGDDHQAIYGFRGSLSTVFRDFIDDYDHPTLQQTLTVNYRHSSSAKYTPKYESRRDSMEYLQYPGFSLCKENFCLSCGMDK